MKINDQWDAFEFWLKGMIVFASLYALCTVVQLFFILKTLWS